MRIIDAHLHLDDNFSENLGTCIDKLEADRKNASINNVVVLHLQTQPWKAEEFKDLIPKYPNMAFFVNVTPHDAEFTGLLEKSINEFGFKGLKLHPRLNEFSVSDPRLVELCNKAGDLDIPVLIDAFPDGTFLMNGFNPTDYSDLALNCPSTKFIWAHCGGQHCIDFMMMCKRLKNVFMDISYSYLYFRGSSVTNDFNYLMKSMRFNKIFYGSDYPDRALRQSLDLSLEQMELGGFKTSEVDKIMSGNFIECIGDIFEQS